MSTHQNLQNSTHAGKSLSQGIVIKEAVAELPEIYQPIYGYPELSEGCSRDSQDRLETITRVHNALQEKLGRSVRVLDLGCAQGFFSLNLAALGAVVHGVDYLDKNIALCQGLGEENPGLKVTFETNRVENVIANLTLDTFDMVIGLSVFHHVVHEHGIDYVQNLIEKLSSLTIIGLFELALNKENLYWAISQPENPKALLKGYAFTHLVRYFPTHLSQIERPLFVASNKVWYLNGQLGYFDSWTKESHVLCHGAHQGTRQYYFGEYIIVKKCDLNESSLSDINIREYQNEIKFLLNPPLNFEVPALILHGQHEKEIWLVREYIAGDLLLNLMMNKNADNPQKASIYDSEKTRSYNPEKAILDVLEQLVSLESAGLYHNDIRVWNILEGTDEKYYLIDYGAITEKSQDVCWPHDNIVSFMIFVREVLTQQIIDFELPRSLGLNILALQDPYRTAFLSLMKVPRDDWSFGLLQTFIKNTKMYEDSTENIVAHNFSSILSLSDEAVYLCQQKLDFYRKNDERRKIALASLENECRIQKREMEVIQKQLIETQADISQQQQLTHQFWKMADEKIAQITAMERTFSWRITAPLRKLNVVVKQTLKMIQIRTVKLIQFPKRILRSLLFRSIKYVLLKPKLANTLAFFLNNLPYVKHHLYFFAKNKGLLNILYPSNAQKSTIPEPILNSFAKYTLDQNEVDKLKPGEKIILMDLMNAIKQVC